MTTTPDPGPSGGDLAAGFGGTPSSRGADAMPWWGWIVVGAVLLGAELFVVPTDFFLVFLGVSAIAVGVVGLAGVESEPWVQWATFGVLSVVSLVFFRGWLKARFARTEVPRVDDTLAGEIGIATEVLAPGAVGSVELRGTVWSARNVGSVALETGARVRVERIDGLTLQVRLEA